MPQHIRLRDIGYLLALANHRHFGRAAAACNVTQPTLSGQITRIESALGVTIFERGRRDVALTPEGVRALEEARRIKAAFDRLLRIAERQCLAFGRTIRFGVIPTVAAYLCPAFVSRLSALNGGFETAFVEELTEVLEDEVAAGRLDFAVTATLPRHTVLATTPIASERLCLVSERPFAVAAEPRPIILMREGHCFRDHAYQLLSQDDLAAMRRTPVQVGAASFDTLLAFVRDGYGDTVLPEPYVRSRPYMLHGLHVRPLHASQARRNVHLVLRRERLVHDGDVAEIVKVARRVWHAPARAAAPVAIADPA